VSDISEREIVRQGLAAALERIERMYAAMELDESSEPGRKQTKDPELTLEKVEAMLTALQTQLFG